MRKLQPHRLTFLALFTYMLSLSTTSATSFTANASAQAMKAQQDAAAAGFVMLSFVNFAMLLVLGSLMNGEASGAPTAEVTFKTAPVPGAAAHAPADAPHAPVTYGAHVPPL